MRLFIAIDIDDSVLVSVAKLQEQVKDRMKNRNGLKWVGPELMHLTLKFLGEVDETRIEEITDAITIVCLEKKIFEFRLSVIGSFGRPAKVLWLGSAEQNAELAALAESIEQGLSELGFEKETRPFSAHLTLARIKDNGVDKNLRRIVSDFEKIKPMTVKVDSVCLYKSQLTSDGPVYTLLRKVELSPVRDRES
ncbi:MAG: RNA 2',3'-cyclic phosphodiesterase [Phycisphaerae bacterium]|nr:RNA 2',3'-cyclic phosphodiesterase [Phycisphaerae bacterium]